MRNTFKKGECTFLLEDLTGIIKPVSLEEKEAGINAGISYSEMISEEEPVSDEMNSIFKGMLESGKHILAELTGAVAEAIWDRTGKNTVLVSLARAGSPAGVLVQRYIAQKYNVHVPHYSISIIRGKGIDENALNTIRSENPQGMLTFIDGWTGKGSITSELRKSIEAYNSRYGTAISADLAVLADPAKLSAIAGTKKDICIVNACLNSTISGLVSRTIHNSTLCKSGDYHGAVFYDNLAYQDMTNYFLDEVTACFETDKDHHADTGTEPGYVDKVIAGLKENYPEMDIHKIKLSIGESSRALLRRKPFVMLIKNPDNPDLEFVLNLAHKKGVPVKVDAACLFDYECVCLLK